MVHLREDTWFVLSASAFNLLQPLETCLLAKERVYIRQIILSSLTKPLKNLVSQIVLAVACARTPSYAVPLWDQTNAMGPSSHLKSGCQARG